MAAATSDAFRTNAPLKEIPGAAATWPSDSSFVLNYEFGYYVCLCKYPLVEGSYSISFPLMFFSCFLHILVKNTQNALVEKGMLVLTVRSFLLFAVLVGVLFHHGSSLHSDIH